MENNPQTIDWQAYIEIGLRRRWLIIIPFCLAMIAGICLVILLPKIYTAKTTILVQPQRVPSEYVQSLVTSDIDSRVNTLSQQIMSRTNLEKIIEEFNLFSDPKYDKMFKEDKISKMREWISVDLIQENRREPAEAFSISFKGTEPEKVMNIVNTLAGFFIDENLKYREAQAVGTSDFLDDELANMRRRLVELEQALKDYRESYMGELPEQLETNLRILDRLQENLSNKQESVRDARSRLLTIDNPPLEAQTNAGSGNANPSVLEDPLDPDQLKERLADLETRYTDSHPDVIRLRNKIADLEAKKAASPEDTDKDSAPVFSGGRRSLLAQYATERSEIRREIRNLEEEIITIRDQIVFYEKRVEATPKREQELLSLKRDYQNIQNTYNSLLERKLEAELAVNMEKKQKGEQFRVLDPARLPEKPSEPDMKKLFLMVVAAGLGIGCGLVFLLEYMDSSFRKTREVESYTGIPVLSSIPVIYQPKDRILKRLGTFVSLFSVMVAFVLFSSFAALSFIGVDKTLEIINKFISI